MTPPRPLSPVWRALLGRSTAALSKPPAGAPAFRAAWRRLAALGLTRVPGTRAEEALAVEALDELGRVTGFTGLHFSLGAQLWGVAAPLRRFGSPAQRRRWLSPLESGRALAGLAVTEEGAGSDALALACEARPDGDGWLLSGRKIYTANAPLADFLLVLARRPGTSGPSGVDCFIVPTRTKGLRVTPRRWSVGPAGAPVGDVDLRDCRVGPGARLGGDGQGYSVFSYALGRERRYLLAPAVGAMQRLLERAGARAWTRRQFGRPIAEFQAVGHKLADMRIRLEAARALLRRCAGAPAGFDDPLASVVKTFISESWLANCLDALQIHGAHGCLGQAALRDELHAALASRVFSGSSEIQRNLIAAAARPLP